MHVGAKRVEIYIETDFDLFAHKEQTCSVSRTLLRSRTPLSRPPRVSQWDFNRRVHWFNMRTKCNEPCARGNELTWTKSKFDYSLWTKIYKPVSILSSFVPVDTAVTIFLCVRVCVCFFFRFVTVKFLRREAFRKICRRMKFLRIFVSERKKKYKKSGKSLEQK